MSTQSINGLIFGATTTSGYTLSATSAQALTIGGNGIVLNSGAQATSLGPANLAITLGAAQSWLNNSGSRFIVGGPPGGDTLPACCVATPSPTPQKRKCAFSLVETALALAIIAFAVTALVALLPGGLSQFREAMDTSICADIFQRVVADVQQMEFDTLLASKTGADGVFFALPTRYFDDQGNEVSAKDDARIIYHARVRVSPPGPAVVQGGTPAFTSLPAAPASSRFAPRDAVFLTVQIAHRPSAKALETGADQLWLRSGVQRALHILTYPAVVTRNGYSGAK